MNKLVLTAMLLFLYSTYASCQVAADKQLAKNIDSLITVRLKIVSPGCAVLVARNGQVIYEKGAGSANLELNVPMQPGMIFRIGSITKQYTAIAILQLAEQGKISLQDSIQQFIKDFPYKGHTITIQNLLTHTSGIMDYQGLNTAASNEYFYYRKDFEPKQIIDFFKDQPLAFTPGSKFAYSNSNYFLLGYIIEIITGKSYRDYLQKNIFDAAGLSHTYYGGYKELVPNRVSGYAQYSGKFENADYVSLTIPYAAGALMSNVEDMFKWHQALYAGKLIKKETLAKAFTPFKLTDGSLSGYGYGWFIKDLQGSKTIEHSGGIDGFQSDEIYLPQQDIFIAALYNSLNEGGDNMSFMDLSNDIAILATGKALEQETKIDQAVLKQYTGVYELDAGHAAIITLNNGRLEAEAPGGGLPKTALFAESGNKFLLKLFKAEFEFVKDKNGAVTQLIVHSNGKDAVCKKIK